MGLFSCVSTHVGFEVIGSGEFPLADFALERSNSGMFSAVASQLVGPGEPLSAALVVTHVRFLTCVLPDVHLEVRKLQVPLGATRVQTHKWLPLFLGLHGLLLTNQVSSLLSDLWHDESWVGRHSHLDWRGTLVYMSIGWNG